MSDDILKKLESIESLLAQLNAKLDHYLEFEELFEDEKKELLQVRQDFKVGRILSFEEFFTN